MSKVAIVTDSNSGITQKEAKDNLFVLPMPFIIDGEDFYEDINLSQEEFYEKLKNDVRISTSQPSFGEVTELWDKILKDYDEIVYIPMSSGLSEACNSSKRYVEEGYNGKVFVVDNKRISITQKASVYEALNLAKKGKTASQIKEYLESTKMDSSIYIMVPTLKYLKKGGRVTPAAAAIASLLSIKPILQIQGEKLDSYAKVMNLTQAKAKMIAAIKKDLEERFKDLYQQGKMALCVAHTDNVDLANKFAEEVKSQFSNIEVLYCDQLSLSVSCHIGPGALALAVTRYEV